MSDCKHNVSGFNSVCATECGGGKRYFTHFSCPKCKQQVESDVAVKGLEQRISELEAEVKHLKNSLGLCHYYAGCDEFVCELDGDMCTGQRVRPIESLIPPPPEAKQ